MRKVMLVEDEEFILQGLENIIDWEALGLTIVHKAHNGVEALEMLERENVEIIVTDVRMPLMDGLELLENVRHRDAAMRFIILTGFSEFEYARSALRLDVEDYILKPINELELIKALENCLAKLKQSEEEKTSQIDQKVEFLQFLEGGMEQGERRRYLAEIEAGPEYGIFYAAIMKVDMATLEKNKITDVIRFILHRKVDGELRLRHLWGGNILLLFICQQRLPSPGEWFANLQDGMEIETGIYSFLAVSDCFTDLKKLPEVYRNIEKLQKYLLIDGYGSCVDEISLQNRTSTDVAIDKEKFSKMILQKDVTGASGYMEDLFVNNMKKDASVDVLYQIAVRIALILQEIRAEYNLTGEGRQLSDIIGGIWQAEDIFSIKAMFLAEITDIISWLNMENLQYTPVVRQIMAEVKNSYQNDMNLKTLAYKYHMNTSYLGQIFQKEVGCPFSQYLNNVRNSVAKKLILTTNMRINDIAREIGYSDTSYFYRKFKQSYGVSPAALRDMKNY